MVLNFQPRFEAKIRAKLKRHTIRAKRRGKRQIRVGDRLDCYVGLRHPGAYLLGRWPCVKIQDIEIHWSPRFYISLEGETLSRDECQALARSDGFESFAEMIEFWKGRLPFRGVMIHWNPDQPQDAPRSKNRRRTKK